MSATYRVRVRFVGGGEYCHMVQAKNPVRAAEIGADHVEYGYGERPIGALAIVQVLIPVAPIDGEEGVCQWGQLWRFEIDAAGVKAK